MTMWLSLHMDGLQIWEQCGGKTGPRGSGIVLGDFVWATHGGPVCPSGTSCIRQVRKLLTSPGTVQSDVLGRREDANMRSHVTDT